MSITRINPGVGDAVTVTYNVGVNSQYTYFRKYGQLVFFQIFFTEAVASGTTIVRSLPTSLRPKNMQEWFPIYNSNGGSSYTRLNVQSAGLITVVGATPAAYFTKGAYIAAQ